MRHSALRPALRWLCLAVTALSTRAVAQPAYLVRNIRPDHPPAVPSPNPNEFAASGNLLYFIAYTDADGYMLWRTDGTLPGTFLPKNLRPGTSDNPTDLTPAGGKLFYTYPYYPSNAVGATDGTPGGTVKLLDDYSLVETAELNGQLLFSNGEAPATLWRSDGTPGGTIQIAALAGTVTGIKNVGGVAYFESLQPGATQLWKSDGTAPGTQMVATLASVQSSGASDPQFTPLGPRVVFAAPAPGNSPANFELWITDGTSQGTIFLRDIRTGSLGSYPANLTPIGGQVFFTADDGASGREPWITDGTFAGTMLLRDIYPSGDSGPAYPTAAGGKIFFAANDGFLGYELWATDGTPGGTAMVKDIATGPSGSYPSYLTAAGDKVYFSAYTITDGYEPWVSDGTAQGTFELADIAAGYNDSNPASFTPYGGKVLFQAGDYMYSSTTELWQTDGTTSGTTKLKDVVIANPQYQYPYRSQLHAALGYVWFFSTDFDLWVSNGTPDGTRGFRSIDISSQPTIDQLTDVEGTLFFSDSDLAHGQNLWVSDGTTSGTRITNDLNPGIGDVYPSSITPFNHEAYFVLPYNGGATAPGLWKSDGTAGGTVIVNPNSPVFGITAFGPRLALAMYLPSGFMPNILIGDGTPAGISPIDGAECSTAPQLTVSGSLLYYIGSDGGLWATDGTSQGTRAINNPAPGLLVYNVRSLTDVNGALYFLGDNPQFGVELWKSDGTNEGTNIVRDLTPGTQDSDINWMTNVNGTLYFEFDDGIHGKEIWKSDGTAIGTSLALDLNPGPGSSDPSDITAMGNGPTFFFTAWAPDSGFELWRSDGTIGGTRIVQEIAPYGASSFPHTMAVSGGNLYFIADDGFHGQELWALPLASQAPPMITLQPASQSANAGQSVAFVVGAKGAPPLAYQWQRGGAPIPGQTQTALNLANVSLSDAAEYRCLVTAGNGLSALSNPATLAVASPPLANSAQFIGATLPPRIDPGRILVVGVTMRDTSAISWSQPQGYALGAVSDPSGALMGAALFPPPPPPFVAPAQGGLCEFIVPIHAPAAPGDTSIQLRMTDPPSGAFGPTVTLTLHVQPRANAARDWEEYE